MKKLGLVLSGGGARGLCHVGVLKVLDDAGLEISCVAGASMGGIVAALYCLGYSVSEIEHQALSLGHVRELIKIVDLSAPRRGLLEGVRVKSLLKDLLGENTRFCDLRIPLGISAVDLISGNEIEITEGNLLPAILATCAVPGIFPPQDFNEMKLVDGGVLNNLPVDLIRKMNPDVVVAVDTNSDLSGPANPVEAKLGSHWLPSLPELFHDFYRAEMLMISRLTQLRLQANPPDILIAPSIHPNINMFLGFTQAADIIQAGELAARNALPEILKLIQD